MPFRCVLFCVNKDSPCIFILGGGILSAGRNRNELVLAWSWCVSMQLNCDVVGQTRFECEGRALECVGELIGPGRRQFGLHINLWLNCPEFDEISTIAKSGWAFIDWKAWEVIWVGRGRRSFSWKVDPVSISKGAGSAFGLHLGVVFEVCLPRLCEGYMDAADWNLEALAKECDYLQNDEFCMWVR